MTGAQNTRVEAVVVLKIALKSDFEVIKKCSGRTPTNFVGCGNAD